MSITVKKLTLMAVLTASALIIFIIEAQIPLPIPVPGVKLGLANAVTLFALFYGSGTGRKTDNQITRPCGPPSFLKRAIQGDGSVVLSTANAFGILLCRILLGAVFTGRLVAFVYSITGGLLGFAAQVIMRRFVSNKQIWVCGAVGAVFHNIGQILAAMFITGTPAIAAYLPIMVIAGIITGVFTGLIAQFACVRLWRANAVRPYEGT